MSPVDIAEYGKTPLFSRHLIEKFSIEIVLIFPNFRILYKLSISNKKLKPKKFHVCDEYLYNGWRKKRAECIMQTIYLTCFEVIL